MLGSVVWVGIPQEIVKKLRRKITLKITKKYFVNY